MFFLGFASSLFRLHAETHGYFFAARKNLIPGLLDYQISSWLERWFFGGKVFVTMLIVHSGREIPAVKSKFLLTSQLLKAASSEPNCFHCVGSSRKFVKAVGQDAKSPGWKNVSFSLLPTQVEKLMYKPSFGVLGKIDVFDASTLIGAIDWNVRSKMDTMKAVLSKRLLVRINVRVESRNCCWFFTA